MLISVTVVFNFHIASHIYNIGKGHQNKRDTNQRTCDHEHEHDHEPTKPQFICAMGNDKMNGT